MELHADVEACSFYDIFLDNSMKKLEMKFYCRVFSCKTVKLTAVSKLFQK